MCDAIVHGTHETPILDSPMKQINGPYLMLALTAAIKSISHACFNGCEIAYRDFGVFVVE
jgi:hypothetical protein